MSTATLVKKMTSPGGAAQRLYRVSPPIEFDRWGDDMDETVTHSTEHVVVSAVVVSGSGPETYIFAADESGDITDWCELSGSYRGDLDHAEALRRAGYVER